MKRHVIIGRFSPSDAITVPVAADEAATQLDLAPSGTNFIYGIGNALDDAHSLGIFPSELGFDLLVLAALVHAADTRIARASESQDSWSREIRLVVPVHDPDRWTHVSVLLKRILDFLTGDHWLIGFRARPASFTAVASTQPPNSRVLPYSCISLFSGGLDSLIGAIDLLECGEKPLLVSHAGEGATSAAQSACFSGLKSHYGNLPFERFRVWMNFPSEVIQGVQSEDSTRGRSFLFFTLGAFLGTGLQHHFTVRAPENGLIALNVPLDMLRLGSLSTRTTHPFYIARWNDLLDSLGIQGRIQNPYWNKTKGEMVAGCGNTALLKELTPHSLSCSSPSKARWLKRGTEQCGYCLPCIIRRAALLTAFGPGGDPTNYTIQQLKKRSLDTNQAEGQQIRSFQLAIDRLQRNPDLAKLLIHKPGPLTDEAPNLSALASVYLRGMEEVGQLLLGVKTRPH